MDGEYKGQPPRAQTKWGTVESVSTGQTQTAEHRTHGRSFHLQLCIQLPGAERPGVCPPHSPWFRGCSCGRASAIGTPAPPEMLHTALLCRQTLSLANDRPFFPPAHTWSGVRVSSPLPRSRISSVPRAACRRPHLPHPPAAFSAPAWRLPGAGIQWFKAPELSVCVGFPSWALRVAPQFLPSRSSPGVFFPFITPAPSGSIY